MIAKSYPYYLANRPVAANEDLPVIDKFTGEVATRVALADPAAIDAAIAAADSETKAMARLPPYTPAAALEHCARRSPERSPAFAHPPRVPPLHPPTLAPPPYPPPAHPPPQPTASSSPYTISTDAGINRTTSSTGV